MPFFSIVVPLFNKREFVAACLQSLVRTMEASGEAELIIVDNGSTDGSGEVARSQFPGARLISVESPGTVAWARNLGAAQARGTILCFVDADCVVPGDYLERVKRVLDTVDADAVGGGVTLPPGSPALAEVWQLMRNPPVDGSCGWVSGAGLAVRRAAFVSAGGFDETLTTQEDVELCARLAALSHPIFESRALTVTHLDNPGSFGAFFAKEVWHGLGMFSLPSWPLRDLATIGTLLHTAMIGMAIATVATPLTGGARVGLAAGLLAVVPVLTVVRRALATRRLRRPVVALLLYEGYYLARQLSMVRLAWRAGRNLARSVRPGLGRRLAPSAVPDKAGSAGAAGGADAEEGLA